MSGNRTGFDRWRGSDGLARLQTAVRCTVTEPETFRADGRWVEEPGVVLSEWRSTALRGTMTGRLGAPVGLMLVLGGRCTVQTARHRWTAERGGAVSLLIADEPAQWSLSDGTHLVRVDLERRAFPPAAQRNAALHSRQLEDGPLVRAIAAALEDGVGAAGSVPGAAPHLCRGLGGLALALLAELDPEQDDDQVDLRERIVEHIEQHLGDQDLSPGSIADAFSISLRWVHQSFNRDGVSVARYIRHRRVDAVAETLRGERRSTRIGLLAARYGFSGREQLSRAFRARYGVTPAAYAALTLEDRVLPEPGEYATEALAG